MTSHTTINVGSVCTITTNTGGRFVLSPAVIVVFDTSGQVVWRTVTVWPTRQDRTNQRGKDKRQWWRRWLG